MTFPHSPDQSQCGKTSISSSLHCRHAGILECIDCHGPPHAIYPVDNPYGEAVDNYQSLQYLGRPGTIGGLGTCTACHLTMPEVNNYHRRMLR